MFYEHRETRKIIFHMHNKTIRLPREMLAEYCKLYSVQLDPSMSLIRHRVFHTDCAHRYSKYMRAINLVTLFLKFP